MINDRVTTRSFTEISPTRNRVQEEGNNPLDMGKRKMESDAASSTILSRRRSLWVGPVFPPVDVPLPSPRGALQRSPPKCWIRDLASRCLRKTRAPWDGGRLLEPR